MSKKKTEVTKTSDKVLSAIGIVLCVILAVILVFNCILLVQDWTSDDDKDVPNIFGYFPVYVMTESMEPKIMTNDLIVGKMISPDQVKVGDVITFFDPASRSGSLLTHRVVEITYDKDGKRQFWTAGDNNIGTDGQVARDPDCATDEMIVGVYQNIRIPGFGWLSMQLSKPLGMVVAVIVPIVLLVGYEVLRRKLSDMKSDEEKQDLMKELEELRRLKAEQEAAAAAAPAAGTQDVPAATDSEKPE